MIVRAQGDYSYRNYRKYNYLPSMIARFTRTRCLETPPPLSTWISKPRNWSITRRVKGSNDASSYLCHGWHYSWFHHPLSSCIPLFVLLIPPLAVEPWISRARQSPHKPIIERLTSTHTRDFGIMESPRPAGMTFPIPLSLLPLHESLHTSHFPHLPVFTTCAIHQQPPALSWR